MASLLYRLGRFSARRRWLVLGAWVLLLAALGFGAVGLRTDVTSESTFSTPGSEASRGLDVVAGKFGGSGTETAKATVVFEAPAGRVLTGEQAAAVTRMLGELTAIDGVTSAGDPLDPKTRYLSADQRVAASTVTFDEPAPAVSEQTRAAFRDVTGRDAGDVRVEVISEFAEPGGGSSTEAIGVVVAFLVLLLTYLSLVAAGANLLTAFVGVGAGLFAILTVGNFVSLNSSTPILALMLSLAVGIDYGLFVFARARTELRAGAPVPEAVAKATGTAGTAVVFAGLTVIIALCGLAVVNIPFLTQMGLGAAGAVLIAVLVAVTAVPALLSLMGRRLLPRPERRREPRPAGADRGSRGFLGRWALGVTRHPVLALVAAVLVLGTAAVPFFSMRTALPSAQNEDPATSTRQAYELLTGSFGPGIQSTLAIVLDGAASTGPDALMATATSLSEKVRKLGNVETVMAPIPAPDGSAALLTVVPGSGPTDDATHRLVLDIRAAAEGTTGAEVLVSGETALSIDVTAALDRALPTYLVVIVGLALLLLLVMFRSVLVPVLATVGFLLSLGAGLGVTTAIFQWGWLAGIFGVGQPGPLLSFMPVMVVGIMFGLAMDYQVFLVSGMHERHTQGVPPRQAVLAGFRQAAPVVVAAAVIMAGVFAGFAFSGDKIVGTIGMALMIGVLADALIVRMVIMPAALTLLGSAGWWMPRQLGRVIPDVDVEGRALDDLIRRRPVDVGQH
ncbi:MMPL family transporter [Winogradskya humida]|uniref:Membrane protein n=1 Tax=Winogradskya humida TaxID=113566 RepID=A0ABQ4A4T8_9ACTN|nr:MMPL family transporter [Actinoplanes humidus]GIE25857.1 membrane protein [Actinoplanes humidus]